MMNNDAVDQHSDQTIGLKAAPVRHKDHISWTKIGVEFAAIVFGVVLGLGLNEWRMSARDAATIEKAEAAILSELTANFDTILAARNYQENQYRESMRIMAEGSNERLDYRGLAAPNTTRAALDAAIATGRFANLSPDTARRYMQIYNEIDQIRAVDRIYVESLASKSFDNNRDFLRFVSTAFSNLLYEEDDALHKMADIVGKSPTEGWWVTRPQVDAEFRAAFQQEDIGTTATQDSGE